MSARDEWLDARRKAKDGQWLIGGSEAAACLGWDAWTSPLQLYYRKRGEAPERGDTDAQEAGRRFEEAILGWYADRSNRLVIQVVVDCDGCLKTRRAWGPSGMTMQELRMHIRELDVLHGHPLILRSRKYSWMSLTVDAFAYDSELGWGIVDAKNLSLAKREEWSRGVPPVYTAQITHYTLPTPFLWGGFATVFGGQQLEIADVLRTDMDPLVPGLLAAERDMVHRLERGLPPPPGATPAERDLLAAMRPEPPGPAVGWTGPYQAGDELWEPEDWDERYESAREAQRLHAQERKRLEAVLLGVADGAGAVQLPGGVSYTIKRDSAGRLRISRRAT